METSNVQINKIEYKDYSFTKASYFGYEILVNDEDKYINITKLLNIINEEHKKNKKAIKEFKDLRRNKDYKEYCDYLKEKLNMNRSGENSHRNESTEDGAGDDSHQLKLTYEIRDGPKGHHIDGTYIHEDLLNYVLIWADKKYALYVNDIMKELNNNNITKVQEMVNDFRNQNKELVIRLKDAEKKTIYEQSNELSNNSKIKLYKLKDKDVYKLSYDQEKDLSKHFYELQQVFTVNSASNILKADGLKQYYNKGIWQFDKSQYDNVINYIKPSLKNQNN